MKSILVAIIAISAPLGAQWLNYPTVGVPKTADGKPNMNAPAPKTADGKPDFSGMWQAVRGVMKTNRPCPNGESDELRDPGHGLNYAAGIPGCFPSQPWAAGTLKQREADLGKDDPTSYCLPLGPPR